MKSLIEKARKSENIKPGLDSEFLTNLIVGYIAVIIQKWRKSEYAFKFKEQVLNDLDSLLDAFMK